MPRVLGRVEEGGDFVRVQHRLARLEDRLLVGTNRDGSCRHCAGREDELGKIVVLHDPPESDDMVRLGLQRGNPPPTLCPACGRDLNTTIVVERVDMIAHRKTNSGWQAESGHGAG